MTLTSPGTPKVSVCIASYNHARYLPECLDSVLAQTYQDFEVVVVDDGSRDGSQDLLAAYQARYPDKIHYSVHAGGVNKGYPATSNQTLFAARGEYIAFIGSDDCWYADKLAIQMALFEADPQLGLVYSYADYMDGSGNQIAGVFGEDVTKESNPLGSMLLSCHTPALTVVVRRQCLDQVGVFDETLDYCDWDLMVRIFSHWKTACVEKSLGKYRIHGHNMSRGINPLVNLQRILAVFRSLEQKSADIGGALLFPRNQAILALQLAFHLFCAGDPAAAAACLERAFQQDPELTEAVIFINDWLNQWKPDFYTVEHAYFGFWGIEHLPALVPAQVRDQLMQLQVNGPQAMDFFIRRAIQRTMMQAEPYDLAELFVDCPPALQIPVSWKKEVLKKIYPKLLFDSFAAGDWRKTRYFWKKTIQADPTWLTNRGVWSIGYQVLAGKRAGTRRDQA